MQLALNLRTPWTDHEGFQWSWFCKAQILSAVENTSPTRISPGKNTWVFFSYSFISNFISVWIAISFSDWWQRENLVVTTTSLRDIPLFVAGPKVRIAEVFNGMKSAGEFVLPTVLSTKKMDDFIRRLICFLNTNIMSGICIKTPFWVTSIQNVAFQSFSSKQNIFSNLLNKNTIEA